MKSKTFTGVMSLAVASVLATGVLVSGVCASNIPYNASGKDDRNCISLNADDLNISITGNPLSKLHAVNGDFDELEIVIAGLVDYDELVKNGTLTQAEADKLQKTYDAIDKLYEGITEDTSEDEYQKITAQAEELYNDVSAIEDKIFVAENSAYYKGLVKDGTLTQVEADKLQKTYDAIDKLYEGVTEDTSEAEYQKLDTQAEKLYESLSAIEDKISKAEDSAFYKELVKNGTLNQAEADKLQKAYANIDVIQANADEKVNKVLASILDIEQKLPEKDGIVAATASLEVK